MIIDIVVLVVLLASFLVFLKKNQWNVFLSSVSLLAITLGSRFIATHLEEVFARNGFAKEGFPVIIAYLVIVIVASGLLYAILSNFHFLVAERYRIIFLLINSLFLALSIGMIICFIVNYFPNLNFNSDSSTFCRFCQLSQTNLKQSSKSVILPKNLGEVIQLSSDYQLGGESLVAENEVLNKINSERTKQALGTLMPDLTLKNLAINYTTIIIGSLRFSHLDVNNYSPAERASQAGIHYDFLGENLAIASDIGSAHTALMNSPTHRQNILSEKFTKVGIAAFDLKNGSIILVEEFSD